MKILLLNQYFHPDVAATAQYATDLARALVRRGHQVTVLASRRAYDGVNGWFPAEECWEGIRIRRVTHTSFGKGARWRRAADFASFYAACAGRLAGLPRFDVVIAMTTPPLVSALGAALVRWRGGRLCLWLMDLNPDQAIAAGWLKEGSRAARALERCLVWSLEAAEAVVVLDRFMRERVLARGVEASKVAVVPPWAHDEAVRYDEEGRRWFRREHGLEGKFVVMYSGNHSPCHPLDTLLEAARALARRRDIAFCFAGGGSEFGKVERLAQEPGLGNIVTVPYQPLERLAASLSAADLHVVVMGEAFVGIVHPCKAYNVLRLGIPLLYIGPERSHLGELVSAAPARAWAAMARHGDVAAVVEHIQRAAAVGPRRYEAEMRLAGEFSQERLVRRLVAILEGGARAVAAEAAEAVRSASA
jgi:glycosyltransferase involved in cell wall biosynthesis